MKEITIDGEVYILKKDIPQQDNNFACFTNSEIGMNDECNISAFMFTNPSDKYRFVNISIDYLQRALKVCELMNAGVNKKKKRESIHLGIGEDIPLLIGEYNKDKHKFMGVIIAPRVE